MKDAEPSALLKESLSYCIDKKTVLDFGAGQLNDTKYLLGLGFSVTAIDKDIRVIEESFKLNNDNLTAIQGEFDKIHISEAFFDLVISQWALSFNKPETFSKMFSKLLKSLKGGGIFCGQFYGLEDDWAVIRTDMTFFSKPEVESLFKDMQIIKLREERSDIKNVDNHMKHWHVFHVIAKKN